MTNKQVLLIILDGWGYREDPEHNAVSQAKTPTFDSLWSTFPHTLLEASGESVGLPEGQMGNSEIGHTTIGAGTTIDTDLVKINKAIKTGKFAENPVFHNLFKHVTDNNSTLHVMGLVSPGGVHSHSEHLYAFIEAAQKAGVTRLAIHAFTDGRDTPPQSSAAYLKELEDVISKVGLGVISTVSGRFYAMDRDNNWHRLQKFEEAIFHNETTNAQSQKPSTHIASLHQKNKLDEHLEPIIFLDENGDSYPIKDHDAIFIFNFRSDRARMLTKKIQEYAVNHEVAMATMTEYDPEFKIEVAYPKSTIATTLAREVSEAGLTQAHIAETEKFPHATYFLNGGKQDPHENEEHILLESRKDIATHDLAPEMQAAGIAQKAVEQIEKGTNFIFINFANPDMVGHTGNVAALTKAIEEVDSQLKKVVAAAEKAGATCFITADHGNAEVNRDPKTDEVHTAHTLNKVPCIVTDSGVTLEESSLAGIAPAILHLLGLPTPAAMTGGNIIKPQ